ncbi:hypothetical protein E1301_Tti021749 [Triplophysa tibetana]|uniref:C2H2-type domain-containing protein n=1 Tax=Triplophysa tibetana TaxID=1572043 RepID=A0A5A9NAD4_9TELE|nr:hypothetical protein E1301_Tti021749 [Triplophysa tibetana]
MVRDVDPAYSVTSASSASFSVTPAAASPEAPVSSEAGSRELRRTVMLIVTLVMNALMIGFFIFTLENKTDENENFSKQITAGPESTFTGKTGHWVRYGFRLEYIIFTIVVFSVLYKNVVNRLLHYSAFERGMITTLFVIVPIMCGIIIIYILTAMIPRLTLNIMAFISFDILPPLQLILLFYAFGIAKGTFLIAGVLPVIVIVARFDWSYICGKEGLRSSEESSRSKKLRRQPALSRDKERNYTLDNIKYMRSGTRYCSETLLTENALRRHCRQGEAHGREAQRCEVCTIGFTQKSNMKLHMKRSHGYGASGDKPMGLGGQSEDEIDRLDDVINRAQTESASKKPGGQEGDKRASHAWPSLSE